MIIVGYLRVLRALRGYLILVKVLPMHMVHPELLLVPPNTGFVGAICVSAAPVLRVYHSWCSHCPKLRGEQLRRDK